MSILVALGFLFLLLILIIGTGIMLFDLSGRREEDAWWLQLKILDRLRRDAVLSGDHILPVAQVPLSKHAAVVVELSGEVRSEAERDAVVEIVREAARKLRGRDIDVDDQLTVVERPVGARVA